MKKVLFITYYWPPSGGAGVQRSLKFVKYLPEYGIKPYVLTVDENSATYPIEDRTLMAEVNPSVTVIKTKSFEALKVLSAFTGKKNVPHGGFANKEKETLFQKSLRYIRGNFFIPDARIGWIKYAVKAASEIIQKENIQTVFISSPPHSSQLIGLELKKRFNIYWIADMRDPWTDIYYYKDLLHSESSAKKDAALEKAVLEKADAVISVSNPINKMFIGKSPHLDAKKFYVIPNGFDETDFASQVRGAEKEFCLTYVGTMADNYRPEVLFKAIFRLKKEIGDTAIRLRMVGSYGPAVRKMIEDSGLSTLVEYMDHVNHDKAVSFMQNASLLILVIPDVHGSEGILTGKLFEYLGAKRPIIALGPIKGEASQIIQSCNAGKMFERADQEALYLYLRSKFEDWKSGKRVLPESPSALQYSRKSLTGKISDLIK